MQRSSIFLLSALVAASALRSQNYTAHPIDNPASSTSQNIPFAGGIANWDEARSQMLFLAPFLPSTGGLITAIELVPAATHLTFPYERFEIWMDQTSSNTLSTTFASNLTNPTLVYSRSPGIIAWVGGNWQALTLDIPFVYDGVSNLVVEVRKKLDRPNNPTITPNVSHRLLTWPRRADLPTPIWAFGTYGSGAVDAPTATTRYSSVIFTRFQFGNARTFVIDSSRDTVGNSNRSYYHLGATMTGTALGTPGEACTHLIGIALSPVPIPIPPLVGGLWLMPTLIVDYASPIIDPSGRGSARLVVPNSPALIGFVPYVQAVVLGASAQFTNAVDFPIAAY